MIFAARGILVSLAFFAVLYCPLASLVVLAWRCVNRVTRKSSRARQISCSGCASFLLYFLCRRRVLYLSIVLADGGGNVRRGRRDLRSRRLFVTHSERWPVPCASGSGENGARGDGVVFDRNDERGERGETAKPALSASNGGPALILVGIWRPRVMVSAMARSVSATSCR